ncbi:MAG: glutamate synthase large subunit [Proteobacteria bacterium]|nr:MAG: glutamate synthase large subunit [Pseudomonadota bacterium]
MDLLRSFKDNCGFGMLANIDNVPSHENIQDAITALERMIHRGAIAADGKSGDGSGLLCSLPVKFLKKQAHKLGVDLPNQFAVAMTFLTCESQKQTIGDICAKNDLKVVLYRDVPIDTDALGELALQTLPNITQIFVIPSSLIATKRFEALLFLARRDIEKALEGDDGFYMPTFSNKVIAYKGLVMPTYIRKFYKDLSDKDFKTSFTIFHQRFSTNTLPQWRLAQPFRTLAHNGEINSISANRLNSLVKSQAVKSEVFSDSELQRLLPITSKGGSDSASLDNMFEFLILNGIDFFKAIRSLIPAPWQNAPHMDSDLRAFYEYSSSMFEPWDGPAAVSFTDGRYIGCVLDRNGLRPAKYILTKDNRILIASEYGVMDIDEDNIQERGRLQSGESIGIDLKFGKILKHDEINDYIKNSNPYTKWLNDGLTYMQEYVDTPFVSKSDYDIKDLVYLQRYFGITQEVKEAIIEPMSITSKEGIGSMGDDTSLAAFSPKPRPFSHFFKQKFAQVTNPPIDPIREKVVMSLNIGFGKIHNFLSEAPQNAQRIKSITPLMMQEKYELLRDFGDKNKPLYKDEYKGKTFSTLFEDNLKGSLQDLVLDVIESIREEDICMVYLDDRGLSNKLKPIPMPMVVGRLNQALLEEGLRHRVSLIAITGEIYDSHSVACLLAYGVNGIYPYLLFASVLDCSKNLGEYEKRQRLKNAYQALNLGLLKIMSKMGISTISSYKNSALFDIIGLSKEIVDDCFSSSHVLLSGLGYEDIEKKIHLAHKDAYSIDTNKKLFPLNIGGFYKYMDDNEFHDYRPNVIKSIHKFANSAKVEDYEEFKDLINNRGLKMIRDFFEFKSDKQSIDISEVESKEEIFKRFNTAAMSLGSISPEAHETMAEAMNIIGGMSNSGEGGEKPERLKSNKNSKIKQVASGRFGVTPEYLASASEIQIKVAQGAKPGEGGQLPGHKVTPLIASLRYTSPGVTLISPPPHHDIYSIEDLAQLIYDLKQINPDALIAVKLVSTAGVGTIAAGVAKAYADKIVISGNDGGTGAAPHTSIKFAGNPWELGLSEAHNTLKVNGLREFVHLQTDGGLKTGLDVVKAALLGAESFAFGTLALSILGCKVLRICHLNRCSVGVATQDEKLREFYRGDVEKLVTYFNFLAQDIREILAFLGYKSIEEIVGRNDLLKVVDDEFAKKFDFSSILRVVDGKNTCTKPNPPYDKNLFEKKILKKVYKVIENPQERITIHESICNTNRSFGTLISGVIAKYYGNKGLKNDSIRLNLRGTSGQSMGAFLINGITINLKGSANDYLGKGMNGGKIIITPHEQGERFSCAGNTCLYGATGGEIYVAGSVGERFSVRNSGATAVVEGVGDHACEYMTGGVVVILGQTGINFGAGMTGGVAFVLDEKRDFIDKLNQELVIATRIDTDYMDEPRHFIKKLLKVHLEQTNSKKALDILENFRHYLRDFWMIRPKDMIKVPLNPEDGD